MKEYRASFIGENGKECRIDFDTMEQAQEFYDGRTETAIQKYDSKSGKWEDVLYPTYEI